MKILVIGTAGFIGYHLAKKLDNNINDYYDISLKHARLNEFSMDITRSATLAAPSEAKATHPKEIRTRTLTSVQA